MTIQTEISQALSLYRSKRLKEAAAICNTILASEPNNLRVRHLRARISLAAGEYADAVVHFEKIPENRRQETASFLPQYSRALRLAGRAEDAVRCLAEEKHISQSYPLSLEFGLALVGTNDFAAAETAFQNALKLKPDCPVAIRQLSTIAIKRGDTTRFIDLCVKLTTLQPNDFRLYPALIVAYLTNSEPEKALALCDERMAKDPAFSPLVAFKYIALSELGYTDELRYLTNYQHLLKRISITPPDAYDSVSEFNTRLGKHIIDHTVRTSTPDRYTTVHGWQTEQNTLFDQDRALGSEMENMIQQAAKQYIAGLPDDQEHPINRTRPTMFNVESWAVVLEQEGHQGPHMHPNSWVSGVYYVKLPTELDRQATQDAGCIVFGQGKYELHPLRKPETLTLRPVEGDFILFPSYFWHHTIPLESNGERICIAFDLVPDRKCNPPIFNGAQK